MLLKAIWLVSLGLAVSSLGTMLLLIVRRIVQDRHVRIRKARQKVLRKIVFDYLESPETAAEFLDRLTPLDVTEIRDMVEDLVRMVRGPAREQLKELIVDLGGAALFQEVLRDGSEEDRLRAVASLALFEGDEIETALRGALDDPSPRVSLAAAQALVEFGADLSVRELIERLDIGDEIRSRGVRQLFRNLASNHKDEMLALLDEDLPDMAKAVLLYGLASLRDPALVPAVAAQCRAPSIDVRAEAIRTLATIGHPDAAPAVLDGLTDASWVMRAQSAICAGVIRLPETMPLLVELLDDEQWWVRFRAARALVRLGAAGRRTLAILAVREGPASEIARAALAEGETG